ncbi:uncharacterized protein MELLADRAFT_115506 [Melampsora larici-populina 98AG31]|uniref:DH domain-containing protein n=1 Tax=Melampsora larici-populina (strain 98AG31 / pathotype 3-4-7) TaxID=747676 RepID=F4RA31_MELLP|nr:uncharacterized protein MELLADRAFT_115506 [Melampsora larici-populina 98AG31]EGG10635.1 hypothetical protein MELLADRAFT_115506 [Melampsora larici-populina 98AG31]
MIQSHSRPIINPGSSNLPPNMLFDLLESERAYVADLFVIIKRIAAAYTPQNLPPPHHDHHFRLCESILRFNKGLLNSLLALGPNPDNRDPIQVAHLLAGWAQDLEPIYGRYCSPHGWAGAGGWTRDRTSMSNPQLCEILLSIPWPNSLAPPPADIFPGVPYHIDDIRTTDNRGLHHATLTTFFALPFARLVYYRRFYEKALNSYQPGSPEHRLLYDASARLSNLLDAGCRQWKVNPIPPEFQVSPIKTPPTHLSPSNSRGSAPDTRKAHVRVSTETTDSLGDGVPSSFVSARDDLSDGSNPSTSMSSPNGSSEEQAALGRRMIEIKPGIYVQQAILDLERTLDTSRCLDIFTMAPKPCQLHMAPANLSFSRSIRLAGDASFFFCPKSDPTVQMTTTYGRLVLLTDLLIFCESMTGSKAPGGADMWLMYPPLAGKHLRISHAEQDERQFQVTIMRKETIFVTVSSRAERDRWMQVLKEAIDHGGSRPGSETSKKASPPKLKANTQNLHQKHSAPPSPAPSISAHHSNSQPVPRGAPRLTPASSQRHTPIEDLSRQPSPDNRSPASPAFIISPSPTVGPSSDYVGRGLSALPDVQSNDRQHLPARQVSLPEQARHGPRPFPVPQSPPSASSLDQRTVPMGLPMHPTSNRPPRLGSTEKMQGGDFPQRQSPSGENIPSSPVPMNVGMASSHARGWQLTDEPRLEPPGSPRHDTESERRPSNRSLPGLSTKPSPPASVHEARSASPRALRKAPSAHSLGHHYPSGGDPRYPSNHPPLPGPPRPSGPPIRLDTTREGILLSPHAFTGMDIRRPSSTEPYSRDRQYRSPSSMTNNRSQSPSSASILPSQRSSQLSNPSSAQWSSPNFPAQDDDFDDDDDDEKARAVPTQSVLAATMRTKVFLKQAHGQWKALGTAKLMVYVQTPGNSKQLVVEKEEKGGKTMISTMVLTDGVERVGRTGVAVDLSDNGRRTGIVYMLQLKSEKSAIGLFEQLLEGSDRRPVR